MKPELNKLAVWRPMRDDGLNTRAFERYPHTEKGIIRVSNDTVFRYCKNYKKGTKKFSLLMVSKDKDYKSVEAFMDKAAKDIEDSDITGRLKVLEVYYG